MNKLVESLLETWSFVSAPQAWPRVTSIPQPTNDLVTLITGVRRCGKSTLLSQLADTWRVPQERRHVINFEDPRVIGHLNTDLLEAIYVHCRRTYESELHYFFFDEIQVVPNWQKWIRLHCDKPKNAVFILTGSNASLLSGELSTVLTGRHRSFELFPLSWAEYRHVFTEATLQQYFNLGGFPRALKEISSTNLLGQYFEDIIEKDIRERLKARSSNDLRRLVKTVFESVGSELSLRRLSAVLKISVDTVSSYLEAAENAYLCFACPFYAYSENQRSHRNKKYYAIDNAMRRAVITPTGKDLGKDLENAVFLELRRKFKSVYYWRGQSEVDFVVESRRGLVPIQVSFDGPKERHHRALEEFFTAFPQAANPAFVTSDSFGDESWLNDVLS